MKIYKDVYLGDKAFKEKKQIVKDLPKKRIQPGVYVITLPTNQGNTLDIYPAFTLKYPIFKDPRYKEIFIVGLAIGRKEALEVASNIALETYKMTGAFDVAKYLDFGKQR